MSKIHMILQGKGGVGKSFISSILAQYKKERGWPALCIDTDPVNKTFSGYKSLEVRGIELLDANEEIDSRNFDVLVELIAGAGERDVIIDNGASSFVPLGRYLLNNQVPDMLESMGHELIIHTVITGSQALLDTLNGFNSLVRSFAPPTRLVVWLNPYWGAVEHEGRSFEQLQIYTTNRSRVAALIPIPDLKRETFGRDIADMLQAHLTFEEALISPALIIMVRQRLKIIRDRLFSTLDAAMVL